MTKLTTVIWIALGFASLAACKGKGEDTTPGKGVGEAINIDRSLCEQGDKRVDSYDLNKDGKPDVWRMYAGQTLVCKQVDFDRDGRKDWIVAYDANGKTLYQQADFDYDGKYDMLAVFDVATGHATEVQRDTDFDGAFDVKEVYGAGGALTSVRRDRNGDSKPISGRIQRRHRGRDHLR